MPNSSARRPVRAKPVGPGSVKSLLAVIFVGVLVVAGVARNLQSSSSPAHAREPGYPVGAPAKKHHPRHVTMHYTASERLLIDSVDIAAGKAMQAAASPDGVFEHRTAQDWCSAALDAEHGLVRRHSLAWVTKVDRARDEKSQKFQQAAKACG